MPEAISVPSVPQPVVASGRPFWLPDTQGFLAVAIILIIAAIAFILLGSTVKFDDKVAGAFMTLLGVLTACLKDVYSFFFGSSKGSEKKDEVISTIASAPAPVAPPTTESLGEAMLSNGQRTYFRTLTDEDAKKAFISASAAEREKIVADAAPKP